MKFSKLLLGIFFLSIPTFAAQTEYLHEPVLSTRVQGMGGAFTAVADDYNALFFNPAGLATLESGQLNMGFQLLGTPTILSFYSDLSTAGNDPVKLTNTLSNYFGSHFASRATIGGAWVRPKWGIAFMPVDLTLEADIHAAGGASVGVQAYQDTLIQFGYAWAVYRDEPKTEEKPPETKPDEVVASSTVEAKPEEAKSAPAPDKKDQKKRDVAFAVGVAPKVVYRGYIEKDLTVFDLQTNSSLLRPSDAQEGLTIDFDLGFLYMVKVPQGGWWTWLRFVKPTFGLGVRNVIDAGFRTNLHAFGQGSSIIQDAKMERRIDAGTKLDLPNFWVFKPRFALDFRDMGTRYASFKKSMHMGVELLWKAFGWLNGGYRLGLSQGYITAGISGELGIFNLDLATYSEEIGTSDAPKESRRYMLKASLDF